MASSGQESLGKASFHDGDNVMNDQHALQPDPGTEHDFNIDINKFAFSPGQLNKMINPKRLAAFHALGGLGGLEAGLRTNHQSGLSVDEVGLEGGVSFREAVQARAAANETMGAVKRRHTSV